MGLVSWYCIPMSTARLEAFSDGVMAIIITITVLGIRVPADATFSSLMSLLPVFLVYIWSFQIVGTYWNNHHHLMSATSGVNAGVMWTNLHLLFWLSFIPFATEWLGGHVGEQWPTAVYCAVLLFAGAAYEMLERAIIRHQGKDSTLAAALGNDMKGKISLLCYVLSVVAAFIYPLISYALVIAVTVMWFIPDRRVAP
jgi:TMEM175 potassium channel family protein